MPSRIEFSGYDYDPSLYNSELIRGEDLEPRLYDLNAEILSRIPPDGRLLDVGCGSALKLLPLSGKIDQIIAIDYNPRVITEALRNVSFLVPPNIFVLVGSGNHLPLDDCSVDMVTYMLCPHNSIEARRVLKPGGYVIAERIGEQDKFEIKSFFTNHDGSPRGYRSNLQNGGIAQTHLSEFTDTGFKNVECREMSWKTKYTKDGLWMLLCGTPTIDQFNTEADRETFEDAFSKLSKQDCVVLTQHRVLVIAQK